MGEKREESSPSDDERARFGSRGRSSSSSSVGIYPQIQNRLKAVEITTGVEELLGEEAYHYPKNPKENAIRGRRFALKH